MTASGAIEPNVRSSISDDIAMANPVFIGALLG